MASKDFEFKGAYGGKKSIRKKVREGDMADAKMAKKGGLTKAGRKVIGGALKASGAAVKIAGLPGKAKNAYMKHLSKNAKTAEQRKHFKSKIKK